MCAEPARNFQGFGSNTSSSKTEKFGVAAHLDSIAGGVEHAMVHPFCSVFEPTFVFREKSVLRRRNSPQMHCFGRKHRFMVILGKKPDILRLGVSFVVQVRFSVGVPPRVRPHLQSNRDELRFQIFQDS